MTPFANGQNNYFDQIILPRMALLLLVLHFGWMTKLPITSVGRFFIRWANFNFQNKDYAPRSIGALTKFPHSVHEPS
jgi:hypothetical protein